MRKTRNRRSRKHVIRLQEIFGFDRDLFLEVARENGPDYFIKFGYDTPEDMWTANPQVEFLQE